MKNIKPTTRIILNLDMQVPTKAAKVISTRANRLSKNAARPKGGGKLRILIPGLINLGNFLKGFVTKVGPLDKKTSSPKYMIFRVKVGDRPAPVAVKPAKPAKLAKGAKVAKVAKVRRTRKVKAQAPAVSNPVNVPPPTVPPTGTVVPASSALTAELNDASAPTSPTEATHARRSRRQTQPTAPAATAPAAPAPAPQPEAPAAPAPATEAPAETPAGQS